MSKFLLSLIIGLFLTQSLHADPITPEAAAAWNNRVRSHLGVGPDFDLREEADHRRIDAENLLKLNPYSREAMRDLGDALHSLGHFAEQAHDFMSALKLHGLSLEMYMHANLPTRESWHNGVEHAFEHIFMSYYDQAIIYQRASNSEQAAKFYELAWQWSEKWYEIMGEFSNNARFLNRYMPLVKLRRAEKKPMTNINRIYSQNFCDWRLHASKEED